MNKLLTRAAAAAIASGAFLAGCQSNPDGPPPPPSETKADKMPVIKEQPPANAPPEVVKTAPPGSSRPAQVDEDRPSMRTSSRVRFGAMPNYAHDGPGVQVDAVSSGTSAADAGIKDGDRLVTWDGKPIKDIYQWMDYLGAANPGDVVEVGVVRDGATIPIKVKLKPAE